MSHTNSVVEAAPAEVVASESHEAGAVTTRRRWERGLATVEYALGVVLIVTVIGAMVWSAQQGWFKDLVKALFETIFRLVTSHLVAG